MDGAMGQEEDVVEAVLTCEGDFHDPDLHSRIERFKHRLKDLLHTEKRELQVKKVEPWNSVRVTVIIPREAASRLRQLAQNGNDTLRQMGILSVQIQGDAQISLTVAGHNSQPSQLILRTAPSHQTDTSTLPLGSEPRIPSSEEFLSSPGSSNEELIRKKLVDYLRYGSSLRQNASIFDSFLRSGGSSVPAHEIGCTVSESNAHFVSQNVATTSLQNKTPGGCQLNNSFPFTKTTGAFHPPASRFVSFGQNITTSSSQHLQSENNCSGIFIPSHGQDNTQANFSVTAPSVLGENLFSPVRPPRLPSDSSLNPSFVHAHLSPSPTSSFLMDLPPPPPYPHKSSSISQSNKPMTSSSPLLINLLQTDPVAVMLANGNPNKPVTSGVLSSGSPAKKKRQSKKAKDGLMKPYSLHSGATCNKIDVHSHVLSLDANSRNDIVNGIELTSHESARDPFSVDLVQPRAYTFPAGHIKDSPVSSFCSESRSLFSPDQSESPSPSGVLYDSNSKSAIGAISSRLSDSTGQETFLSDLEPFSMGIAAGKIVNPYTGQLEPRDSILNSGRISIKDENSISQGNNFATQILGRKAKELEKQNKYNVPKSSFSLLDAHSSRTAILNPVIVSTSTAAVVPSDGPLILSSGKSRIDSSKNLINSISGELRENKTLSSSIYAVNETPWGEPVDITNVNFKSLSSELTDSIVTKLSVAVSSPFHSSTACAPVVESSSLKNSVNPSHHHHHHNHHHQQHHHIVTTSVISGARYAPQESVIYSKVTMSSVLPLPVSHQMHTSQSQRTNTAMIANHVVTPNSLSSKWGLSFASSHLFMPQSSERLNTVGSGHISTDRLNQAARLERIGDSIVPKQTSPNLLNSLPDRHIVSVTGSPPDNKALSEGDENSNHSGLTPDILPEQSGNVALLEHSGVKVENHDSGLGSSSERSDDTPSEPGDGEFRSGQVAAESEDTGKILSQEVLNCQMESKMNSNSNQNIITVGYMMNSHDSASQSKLTQIKFSSPVPSIPVSTNSQFFHTHIQSLDKQAGHSAGLSQISHAGVPLEENRGQFCPNYSGNVGQNSPSTDDMGKISTVKMNGPHSKGNIEKMIMVMNEIQKRKMRAVPKQNAKKGLKDAQIENQKMHTKVLEKGSEFHQFVGSAKETLGISAKENTTEKNDSSGAISQRLNVSQDKPDQLIFDMEELVNGKTLGHGLGGIEGKGGCNITSIYSKRSSPVNVNMLNHIYAPGLPLPRRLTESVQRLVKPLPALETSVMVPQMRPCKSPASVGSPRSVSSTSSQGSLRTLVQGRVQSPVASIPKLIPIDKHSLLSGGLDLAGLPNPQHGHTVGMEQISMRGDMVSCKGKTPALLSEASAQGSHFLARQNSPSNLFLDFKSCSGKILSQSFPPQYKLKDKATNNSNMNHDLLLSLHSELLLLEKNSLSLHATKHKQFSKFGTEGFLQKNKHQTADKQHDSCHLSSGVSSTESSESAHSTSCSQATEISVACSSRSSASSPVTPFLQQGQESGMPRLSSQQFFCSAEEILPASTDSSVPLNIASASSHNKCVPYSNFKTSVSDMTSSAPTNSVSVTAFSSQPPVPKASAGTIDSPSLSPSATLSSLATAPSQLKKVCTPINPQSSSRSGCHIPQFSQNLFESVSGTLNNENIPPNILEQLVEDISMELGTTLLQAQGGDSEYDSLSSVLVSKEPQVDLTVRSMQHKTVDSGDKRTEVVASHNRKMGNLTTELVHTSLNLSQFSSLSTEIINLNSTVSSQAPSNNSLNMSVVNDSICENDVTSSLYVVHNLQEGIYSQTAQPPVSPLPSLTNSDVVLSHSVDTIAEAITSAAAATDEAAIQQSTAPISVKDSIQETLAVTLMSTMTETDSACEGKYCAEEQIPFLETSLDIYRLEGDAVSRSKILTMQSDSYRPQSSIETSPAPSLTTENSEAVNRRLVGKRKYVYSTEEDSESSAELLYGKQSAIISNLSLVANSVARFSVGEDLITKRDCYISESEQQDNEESSEQSKSLTAVVRESQEEGIDYNSHSTPKGEVKESSKGTLRSARLSFTLENKEETNTLQSDVSTVPICHQNTVLPGEMLVHHFSTNSTDIDDKDLLKDSLSCRASLADHKENSFKETSPQDCGSIRENAIEDKDDCKESQLNFSLSDRPKIKSVRNATTRTINKGLADTKFDEGLKRNHCIKRQFYAYIPEKLIDQTYFDTPVLSGRTRSRNKPTDPQVEDATSVQDGLAVNTSTVVEFHSHLSVGDHQVALGKADGSVDIIGGKRPIRSVRTKDSSHDNTTSKRRRVQQHR